MKVNWFGLAGGALILVVAGVSLAVPWWQVTAGENLVQANVSPFATNFNLLGTSFTIPLLWALNLVAVLSFVTAGIVMLIYSVIPDKPYSVHLLGFAYKKPLYSIILFVVILFLMSILVLDIANLYIPLFGSATSTLPMAITEGVTVSVTVSSGFLWPFWLAVISAVLCILARIYHHRVAGV